MRSESHAWRDRRRSRATASGGATLYNNRSLRRTPFEVNAVVDMTHVVVRRVNSYLMAKETWHAAESHKVKVVINEQFMLNKLLAEWRQGVRRGGYNCCPACMKISPAGLGNPDGIFRTRQRAETSGSPLSSGRGASSRQGGRCGRRLPRWRRTSRPTGPVPGRPAWTTSGQSWNSGRGHNRRRNPRTTVANAAPAWR